MTPTERTTIDANEAVARVAYRLNEVIAIYPITPASPMGELADEWASRAKPNLWGVTPTIEEMQAESGAAGAVHGALQGGALATTFTASQGLLLMIPNMYKIAGELSPFCLHVAARSVATHALSIFCDHSDVMACRGTGFAMLASSSVQEAHDFAAIAQAATLRARVPFLHFFDGFRTSHELSKIELLSDDDLRALVDESLISDHRARALDPDRPVVRGTAQNPDTFFQAREAANPFYDTCSGIVEAGMKHLADLTGRRYHLFDYFGATDADRVLVIMGSAAETAKETVEHLARQGQRVGVIVVRLYRPFDVAAFATALPATARRIAVLDRTKEPGAPGEPLYLDVVGALAQERAEDMPLVVGGRYGLSSKELTPSMIASVLSELDSEAPLHDFTVGIFDDVTHRSLPVRESIDIIPPGTYQALFYGLGSDGTVGANKNTIKIIGEETDLFTQGYFVYDSKKSGSTTVSHLRFGKTPIRAPYLIADADFVGCHQFDLLDRFDVLGPLREGGVLLLNAPFSPDRIWQHLSEDVQRQIREKKPRLYAIDAYEVARTAGLGGRINTVMQTCFFALSGVIPRDDALDKIERSIERAYAKRGSEIVHRNVQAVRTSLEALVEIPIVEESSTARSVVPPVPPEAPDFVQRVTAMMLAGRGDKLPVSAFPVDGTWPTGTSQWEKRNLAAEIPVWDPDICIQCNKCVLACPHAAVRAKVYPDDHLKDAPEGFVSTPWKNGAHKGKGYTIQVAPEDCTGCRLCAVVCPAKDKGNPRHKALDMHPARPRREAERERYSFFLNLPEVDRDSLKPDVKESQLLRPLFEYSGACAGCGETPYIKLLTQLFGDRAVIANATGCSSIYGGNLPTTPYTTDAEGRGPAWSNSLFEDNAEFGFGIRLALDHRASYARYLLEGLSAGLDEALVKGLLSFEVGDGIEEQRKRVEQLRACLRHVDRPQARVLEDLSNAFVPKSVWLVGGDGWAYDIGFGGLDHVLASNRDINVLVLDTEVYSNTGGQQSKATPLGAAAKFAAAGKSTPKKDLGLMAMSYPHVYVAQVAFGAKDAQTVRAFVEAEAHRGPSLIIAYSHCIAHGYDLSLGAQQQKRAVDCGIWPLYRYDPRRVQDGHAPLVLDSGAPKIPVHEYMAQEARFRMVEKRDAKRFKLLQEQAQADAARRTELYQKLAHLRLDSALSDSTSETKGR